MVENLREPSQPSDCGQVRFVWAHIGHSVSYENRRSQHPVLHPGSPHGGCQLWNSGSLESWMDLSRSVLLNCFVEFVKIERRKSRQPGIYILYNLTTDVCSRFSPLVYCGERLWEIFLDYVTHHLVVGILFRGKKEIKKEREGELDREIIECSLFDYWRTSNIYQGNTFELRNKCTINCRNKGTLLQIKRLMKDFKFLVRSLTSLH